MSQQGWDVFFYVLLRPIRGGGCGAPAGRPGGRSDALGCRQQADLGSDLLHPAGAGESLKQSRRDLQLVCCFGKFNK